MPGQLSIPKVSALQCPETVTGVLSKSKHLQNDTLALPLSFWHHMTSMAKGSSPWCPWRRVPTTTSMGKGSHYYVYCEGFPLRPRWRSFPPWRKITAMTSMAKGSCHDVHGEGFPPWRSWRKVPTMTFTAKGSHHDVHGEGFPPWRPWRRVHTMTSMAKGFEPARNISQDQNSDFIHA